MSPQPQYAARIDIDIPWDQLSGVSRRAVSSKLGRVDSTDLDDLVQESMVRLVRVCRRENPDNLVALTRLISERVAIDFIRRRSRWRLVVNDSLDIDLVDAPAAAAPLHQWGDPVERTQRVLQHCFADLPDCLRLAERFVAEVEWSVVATELGQTHASVRQRWKRCLDSVRSRVVKDTQLALLLGWEP